MEEYEKVLEQGKEVLLSRLEPFDIPPEDIESLQEREKILSDLRENYENRFGEKGKKDERALVIGRFQPLHPGHTLLIDAAAAVAKKVVILICSPKNKIDKNNPFLPEDRELMLCYMLKRKGLLDRVEIIYQDDIGNNFKWGDQVLKKAQRLGEIDVVMSNHESTWINGIFRSRGKRVYEIDTLKRDIYRSTNIRERLRQGTDPVLNPDGLHRINPAPLEH